MSYARNTNRFFYAPTFVEFNSEHFSQPGVRVKWQEVVRFMKSVFFDPKPTDPTDSYANVEGGLRFDSVQHRFRYRNNTQWKYFGDGDGDVQYDTTGANPKADTGVARWSPRADGTGNWIQGSLVTIDDTGFMNTPESYRSLNNGVGHRAFVAQKALGFTDFVIGNDGTHVWSGDTTLVRNSAQALELQGSDSLFLLSGTGNSRVQARKHLGGIGNSSVGTTFRCPVTSNTYGFYQNANSVSSVPATNIWSTPIYSINIPANALSSDGDMLQATLFFETSNSALVKRITPTFRSSSITGTIAGSATYTGTAIIRVFRMSSSQCVFNLTGTYEGSVLGSANAQIYKSDMDWTIQNNIDIALDAVSSGGVVPAGEIKHNGAIVTYFNQ